ncbi:MAG: hypothetical protein EOP56_09220 [Sphingobacteriales bacterium]|nr:MAG: hypothetical protein EOP56_09220 [Sphingobacteriales bacterium]
MKVTPTQSREIDGILIIESQKGNSPIKIHGEKMLGVEVDNDLVYGLGTAGKKEIIGKVDCNTFSMFYFDPYEVKFRRVARPVIDTPEDDDFDYYEDDKQCCFYCGHEFNSSGRCNTTGCEGNSGPFNQLIINGYD